MNMSCMTDALGVKRQGKARHVRTVCAVLCTYVTCVYICEYGRMQQNAENGDQSWLRSPGFWVILGSVICKTEMIQALANPGPCNSTRNNRLVLSPVRDQTDRPTSPTARQTTGPASQSPDVELAAIILLFDHAHASYNLQVFERWRDRLDAAAAAAAFLYRLLRRLASSCLNSPPHPALRLQAAVRLAQHGVGKHQRRIIENSNKHKNQKKAQGKPTSVRALNHGETLPTPLYLSEYSDPAGRSDLHCCRRLPHLPRQTDICFLIFAFAGSFFVVHACCLRSRFGPRGHYSLWGCQAGHGRATGILHDWSSAAEPLTRSDESFHSRAGHAHATVASVP